MPTTHGNGQDPVPTLRTVFDWYLKNMPRQCHPTALADRKRIWDLFCRYRGEDNGPPGLREHYHPTRWDARDVRGLFIPAYRVQIAPDPELLGNDVNHESGRSQHEQCSGSSLV